MFGLNRLTIYAVLLAAGLTALAGLYAKGRYDGAASERAASLQRSLQVLRSREAIDAQTHDLSTPDLCVRLGGVWTDDGKCL